MRFNINNLTNLVLERFPAVFDAYNAIECAFLRHKQVRDIFTSYYKYNKWLDPETRSGAGSNLQQTAVIRAALPDLLRQYNIRTLVDLPCGDFYWMRMLDLDLDLYIGLDIVEGLVHHNQEHFGRKGREFRIFNAIEEVVPACDLVFSRDMLVHFSNEHILATLHQVAKSQATYFLTTHFNAPGMSNKDIATGCWRPINLEKTPFNLPAPLLAFSEHCPEKAPFASSKTMALWTVESLRIALKVPTPVIRVAV